MKPDPFDLAGDRKPARAAPARKRNNLPVCARKLIALFASLALAACAQDEVPVCAGDAPGLLITNVMIVDGSGAPAIAGSVRVADGSIVAVGNAAACDGDTVVDGGGQVLAPGFIDTHSHADADIFEHPDALPLVSQGITTVWVGGEVVYADGAVTNARPGKVIRRNVRERDTL
jgi:hypothetical protein